MVANEDSPGEANGGFHKMGWADLALYQISSSTVEKNIFTPSTSKIVI